MPVAITCPNCRTSFRAPDHAIGKNVRCTKCQKPFLAKANTPTIVPAASAAKPASRPPAKRSRFRAAVYGVTLVMMLGLLGLGGSWLYQMATTTSPAVASNTSSVAKTSATEAPTAVVPPEQTKIQPAAVPEPVEPKAAEPKIPAEPMPPEIKEPKTEPKLPAVQPPEPKQPPVEVVVEAEKDAIYLSDRPVLEYVVAGKFGRNGVLDDGKSPITVQGKASPKGLTTHPSSNKKGYVEYAINKEYQTFKGAAGIDDSARRVRTELTFEIYGDGTLLWKSKGMQKAGESEPFVVPVAGIKVLELRVACPGSSDGALAVWIEPRLLKATNEAVAFQPKKPVPTVGKPEPEAPVALAAQPAKPDKTTRAVLDRVYVGCQASKNDVIRILNQLKGGVYDLEFDAKANQARFRVGITDPQQIGNLASKLFNGVKSTGLNGWPMFPDLPEAGISKGNIGAATWKLDELVLDGIYAASVESQQALRDLFKDCQVTFYGEGRIKMVQLAGKGLDYATAVEQLDVAGFRSKPASLDSKVAVRVHGVYLQCEPSQQAARRVLEQVPGLSNLVLDPAARTISCRVPRENYAREFQRFGDSVDPTAQPLGTARNTLGQIGLASREEFLEPINFYMFQTIGTSMRLDGNDMPAPAGADKEVVLYQVFAASPEARTLVEKSLAPHKVAFIGNGEQRNVRIEGEKLSATALQKQLIDVGLFGSTIQPKQGLLTAKDTFGPGTTEKAEEAAKAIRKRGGICHLRGTRSYVELQPIDPKELNAVLAELRPHLASLPELSITVHQLDDQGMAHLKDLQDLVMLNFDMQKVIELPGKLTDAGVANLANCKKLQYLGVRSPHFTPVVYSHLAGLTELKKFGIASDARDIPFSDATLAHFRQLVKLEELFIRCAPEAKVTDTGIAHLKNLVSMKDLALLGPMSITDQALESLAGMTKLETLNIDDCPGVTNAGMARLQGLPSLKALSLAFPGLSDEGIAHLKPLAKLQFLYLRSPGITDATLAHIQNLPNLKELQLSLTKVSEQAAEKLRRSRPGLRVVIYQN